MSLKKNLVYNFLLSFSQVAFPLISIPYVSRVLDPDGIGKVGFIDSLTYYFIVIAEFGIATYGIREVSRKRENRTELNKLVSELVSLHILTSLVCIFIYIAMAIMFFRSIIDTRLLLFSVAFLLVNSFACEWYFWGTEKFKYITLRSVLTRVLGLIAIFLLVKAPEHYTYYYGIIVFSAVLNIFWNFKKIYSEVELSFRNIDWRRHISSVKVTYQISLLYCVVIMLDNVFLQMLGTSVAVAYYMFAAKVVRIAGALVSDALQVFYPRTVSLVFNNEKEAFKHIVLRSSQLIWITAVPMAVGIFLLAAQFTNVYFGEAFAPLVVNLKILALYPLLKAFSLFLNKQLMMPFDQEKFIVRGLWIGTIVFVCTTIPLSYWYADKGTSLAIMLSEMTVLLSNFYYFKKLKSGVQVMDYKTVVHSVTGALFFLPIVYVGEFITANAIIKIIAEVACCVLVYVLFLVFFVKNEMVASLKNHLYVALANKQNRK